MRIKQAADNGNVVTFSPPYGNPDNRSWFTSSNTESGISYENRTDSQLNINTHNNAICDLTESTDTFLNYTTGTEITNLKSDNPDVNVELVVCNRQYRINTQNNVNIVRSHNNTEAINLEERTETVLDTRECCSGSSNVYSDDTPIEEDRVFDHSDTDEMSENGIHSVPRGIVNPNYPGFQHLAHTLQDYSSNIENFYHSENDMTDDDVDIEIAESTYDLEPNHNRTSVEYKNINNNNEVISSNLLLPPNTHLTHTKILDSHFQSEIPDLLKAISNNNNNETVRYDLNCSDADIEINFHTKDIIGDFNKEIEEEIKLLLNYNINIQDDLEELRKDIKDTFAKPIETTINNISEVVNHVIKKLVKTQFEFNDETVDDKSIENEYHKQNVIEELPDINKENEINTRTEMNLSRPTFLLIDTNTNSYSDDAFLSDGKDEIDIKEYDTEKLSCNVENTIKQLSTELRKIIPKLDEMKERDRLWAESKKETDSIITDDNSNEIPNSSKYSFVSTVNTQIKSEIITNVRQSDIHNAVIIKPVKSKIESKEARDQMKEISSTKTCFRNAQNDTSVRINESAKDIDLDSFDVYNIETALPKLDLDAIENHLRAAKEAERRKRNDREEIRKRLAMGADTEEYYSMGHTDRPGKKPSLHSRLQSGMNLQICFMNETASDNESQASDMDRDIYNTKNLSRTNVFSKNNYNHPYQTRPLSVNITKHDKISTAQSGTKIRPSSLTLKTTKSRSVHSLGHIELKESDFYALQATLQTEARIALAQAKEMARIQMERERRSRPVSPVTEMLQRSMQKASAPLAPDRRRVSRQLLTDMNIAQLQVIVNELHSQIESLNDTLVKLLMARDELHMGQDSMLVDIEDLTRYLGVKEQTKKTKGTKTDV